MSTTVKSGELERQRDTLTAHMRDAVDPRLMKVIEELSRMQVQTPPCELRVSHHGACNAVEG